MAPVPPQRVSLRHDFSVVQPVNALVAPLDRPVLLIVHGALGDAEQMRPLAEALDAICRVQLVELPGHGTTVLPDDVSFEMALFADVLGDVARRHRLGDHAPICFGYSMGGYAALLAEARSPGTFGGIVTLGTKFEWTPPIAATAAARLDAAVLRAKVPAFAEQLRVRHEGAGGWEQLLTRTAQLLTELGATSPLNAQTLQAIGIPVCLAVGSRDDTTTAHETEHTALRLTQGTSHILADVPHPIERVPTTVMIDLIRDFLRDHPRS